MRTRRIVSSIAALTIAAGAFAGMAVTASAAEVKVYDTLGAWSVTKPAADRVVGSVTNGVDGELEYTTVQVTAGASHSGVYNGSVHIGSTNGGAASAATRSQGTRVATQKIRFTDGSGSNIVEYIGAAFKSGGGSHRGLSSVAQFSYNDDTNTLTIKAGNGENKTVEITDGTWYDLTVTAVYDGEEANVTMTVGDVTATGTAANYDINQFAVSTLENGSDVSKFDSTAETIATLAPAATKLTINYIDDASNVLQAASEIALSDIPLGNTYIYNIPRYIVKDGALYESVLESYMPSVELSSEESSVDAVYKAQETGTAYFVEHEVLGGAQNTSGNYSGGTASRALDGGAEAFTVTEDGIYSITVAACCRNTSSSSVYSLYKNSVAEENFIATHDVKGTSSNSIKSGGTITDTKVELKAGDKVIIQGDSGQTWVDYVLAVRTGDIEDPEPTLPGETEAKLVKDFNDQGLADAENGASIWSATVEGTGTSYSSMTATVKAKDIEKPASDTKDVTTITTTGDVLVYVVVNRASEKLDSVKITVE